MCKGPEVTAREAASPGPGAEGAETRRARSGGDPAPQAGRTTWVPAFPSGPSCKLLTGREGDTHRYCFWESFPVCNMLSCLFVIVSASVTPNGRAGGVDVGEHRGSASWADLCTGTAEAQD